MHSNTDKKSPKPETILIKKYGNRRLYDTAGSRYVNLDDIARFIREGNHVRVIDAETKRDLTRVVLTQIITEDAKEKPTGLPLELLRQLIVASDEVRQEFVMWYLKSAFDSYQKVQDALQNRLTDVQSAILSPVDMMKSFLGSSASTPRRTEAGSEVDALRRRVTELEARLEKREQKKRKRRKR